jgi:hypothetical protein
VLLLYLSGKFWPGGEGFKLWAHVSVTIKTTPRIQVKKDNRQIKSFQASTKISSNTRERVCKDLISFNQRIEISFSLFKQLCSSSGIFPPSLSIWGFDRLIWISRDLIWFDLIMSLLLLLLLSSYRENGFYLYNYCAEILIDWWFCVFSVHFPTGVIRNNKSRRVHKMLILHNLGTLHL